MLHRHTHTPGCMYYEQLVIVLCNTEYALCLTESHTHTVIVWCVFLIKKCTSWYKFLLQVFSDKMESHFSEVCTCNQDYIYQSQESFAKLCSSGRVGRTDFSLLLSQDCDCNNTCTTWWSHVSHHPSSILCYQAAVSTLIPWLSLLTQQKCYQHRHLHQATSSNTLISDEDLTELSHTQG